MEIPALPPRYRDPIILGHGAVGIVLLAKDTLLKRRVAIKLTQAEVAKEARFQRLFAREIRLQAGLVHPNIVPLLDAGVTQEGRPFLVMAHANLGSFASFRRSPPPWPELLRLSQELLSALGFIHAKGVLHRDLKPENVLLHRGRDGVPRVWLADLGAANLTEDMPKEEEIGGTPMYIAPEHAAGDVALLSRSSDLFAVAAMLKEFITGFSPFQGETLKDLLDQKEQDPPPFIPRQGYPTPHGLCSVLNHQLAPHFLDRYDLAADLSRALGALGPPALSHASPSSQDDGTLNFDFDPEMVSGIVGGRLERHKKNIPRWLKAAPTPFPDTPPQGIDGGLAPRISMSLFPYRRPAPVGRSAIKQRLWALAGEVITTGTPRVCILVGEAGSGKSRLAEALATDLEQGGWMERMELRYQNPPGPNDGLIGAIRRELRPDAGSRFSVADRAAWRLSRWRGELKSKDTKDARLLARRAHPKATSARDGAGAKSSDVRWFLYEQLEASGWRGGSLLILEDAQWASEGEGLAYAEGLLRSQGTMAIPALTLVTIREEVLRGSQPLQHRCQTLEALGAETLHLGKMPTAEIESVLQAYLALEPAFAKEVALRCEGSPLFAHQLLEAWVQQRMLAAKGGLRFALKGGKSIDEALPPSTEALLLERVEALISHHPHPERLRYALHIAALAGQEGPISLLEMALGGPWSRALLSLSNLILQEDRFFRFQHGLLREALLRQAESRKDAPDLHLVVARGWLLLEQQSGEASGLRVADHLLKGGRGEASLSRCIVAAQEAFRGAQAAHLMAAASLGLEGGSALGLQDGERRIVALTRFLALAREQQGELAEARSLQESLLKGAAQREDQRLMELHLRDLGRLLLQEGAIDASAKCYDQALALAKGRKDERASGECLRGMGIIASRRGERDKAQALLEGSIKRAKGARDREGEAWGLYELAKAGVGPGQDLRREEALTRESLKLAEALLDDRLIGACQELLAEVVKWKGDLSTARIRYNRCARFFSERHQAELAAGCLLNMAMIELTLSRTTEAQLLIEDARRHLSSAPRHYLQPVASLYEAVAQAQSGAFVEAGRSFDRALEQGLGQTVDHDLAPPLDQLATYAARSGKTGLARRSGSLAQEVWTRLGDPEEAARIERTIQELMPT